MVNLLKQAKNFHYHNRSIPKNDPVHSSTDKELSNAIHNKMQSCGIVIVLAGASASYSKWIDKEIKIAKSGFRKQKPILVIKPSWGNKKISSAVKKNADSIVEWNTEKIVSAIKELA